MLIPILFVIGFVMVGVKVGRKLQPSDFHIGAALPAQRTHRVSYVRMVNEKLARNIPVSQWLVCEATREAFDAKDWATVRALSDLFDEPVVATDTPAPEKQEEGTTEDAPQKPDAPDTSPLDGVEIDDWCAFVKALSTRDSGHRSDRYVGKYEQNVSRLRQLGIEAPQGEEDEYKALIADMTDYWDSQQSLIHDQSGEVLKLKGEDHPVTPSGILGLLKAAGPQGARSWLENEADRVRFPKTTETFLRTNGCF